MDLLLAVENLWHRELPIRVVLAGPEMPNFRAFWDEFTTRHPACPVVRLGPLTDAQKRDFFAGIDVFALPSRSDSFGLVLLEAWANGVPCVAYRAGGIADVIRDGCDGRLVPCGDVAQLANAIAKLNEDKAVRQHFGAMGLARIPAEYRWRDKLDLVCERYALTHSSTVIPA